MKRYTVYELGAQGPKFDYRGPSFWRLRDAQALRAELPHTGVFDNWKNRWVS